MTMNASQPGSGILASVISMIVLLFSAGGAFGELQDSMNVVFDVQPKPNQGILAIVGQRFFSLTLVVGTAFLLLVSLIVSAILSSMVHSLGIGLFWNVINFVISFAVISCLFALIFKYLPDVKLPWRAVWYGAGLTAILFTIGKMLLGWYLGRGSTISVYGAAGSLAALLIWTYYSALILFYGAEVTKAVARLEGYAIEPTAHAVSIPQQASQPAVAPHAAAEYRPMAAMLWRRNRNRASRGSRMPATVAGLAAGAVLGGVGLRLLEQKIAEKRHAPLAEDVEDRIRELDRRVKQTLHDRRLFRARAVDDYIAGYKNAHSAHPAEKLQLLLKKVVNVIGQKAV